MTKAPPPVVKAPFEVGDVIKDTYILTREVGAGGFGAIYSAKLKNSSGSKQLALKFEKGTDERPLLYNEVMVLKAL